MEIEADPEDDLMDAASLNKKPLGLSATIHRIRVIVKSSASSREETVVAGVIKSLVVAVAARSTSEPSSGSVVDIVFSFKLVRDNKAVNDNFAIKTY